MDENQLKALIAFGKLGMQMASARIVSLLALLGGLALSGYVAYAPTWQGAACVGVVWIFGFIPALRAETKSAPKEEG